MKYFDSFANHPSFAGLRSRAAAYSRQFRLDRAIRRARAVSAGPLPDDVVAEICDTWGDSNLLAADGYLRALLIEAQKAHGHILQCGADLTTLLLAIAVERRGVRLWTLESSAQAANAMRAWLTQYQLTCAHIIAAPADLDAAGVGYGIDVARLPGPFSLLVCEASNAHPGNARRLLPLVADKLSANAVVLARNVRRRSDFDYLGEWGRGQKASLIARGKTEPFAKIVLRDTASTDGHDAARINTAFARKIDGVKSMRFSTSR